MKCLEQPPRQVFLDLRGSPAQQTQGHMDKSSVSFSNANLEAIQRYRATLDVGAVELTAFHQRDVQAIHGNPGIKACEIGRVFEREMGHQRQFFGAWDVHGARWLLVLCERRIIGLDVRVRATLGKSPAKHKFLPMRCLLNPSPLLIVLFADRLNGQVPHPAFGLGLQAVGASRSPRSQMSAWLYCARHVKKRRDRDWRSE